MACNQRLLGVVCEQCEPTTIAGITSHSGKTTTANGGGLLLTWTYIPPSVKQEGT